MDQTPATLWHVVELIVQQMPTEKVKLEQVLSTKFSADNKVFNDLYYFFVSDPIFLQDRVVLSQVRLSVMKADSNVSAVGLDVNGSCITLSQVIDRFGALKLTDAPRGRSLEEVTTYSRTLDRSDLAFGFKESASNCLAFVSVRSKVVR